MKPWSEGKAAVTRAVMQHNASIMSVLAERSETKMLDDLGTERKILAGL